MVQRYPVHVNGILIQMRKTIFHYDSWIARIFLEFRHQYLREPITGVAVNTPCGFCEKFKVTMELMD